LKVRGDEQSVTNSGTGKL